ncbi:hypothetical protein AOQ84DRAFT_364695 [Glonium stellatum]|uniref:Uncharacterized protein n=1 Tax=Glonium stellatum TaxID=574774 RepID=A0A8E2EZX9_9PEZI|nr:hypothetical protein AOQ84DRAFT_364695 [Glonium stellatum]
MLKGVDALLKDTYQEFKDALAEDFETRFWLLVENQDKHSIRAYTSTVKKTGLLIGTTLYFMVLIRCPNRYPFPVIQWLEAMDSATGLYDQAFVESVMDSLDFDYLYLPMSLRASHAPSYGKRVKKIAKNGKVMKDFVMGENGPRRYCDVISILPLSCLRLVDLEGAELDWHEIQGWVVGRKTRNQKRGNWRIVKLMTEP